MDDVILYLVFAGFVTLVVVLMAFLNRYDKFFKLKSEDLKERKKLYGEINWFISAKVMEMGKQENFTPPPKAIR